MANKVSGEYKTKGEYHRKLDKNWKYLPVYLEKMRVMDEILRKAKDAKILDAGCGEGLLVEKYRKRGFDILGLDINYSSKYVKKGDIKKMPFKDETYDMVLFLDVLEHINVLDQRKVIDELYRVTKKKGVIIFGLPNLAHFASRISFLFTGNLIRTSEIERHVGDRPIKEFMGMMKDKKLKIVKRIGLFPTFPLISLLTIKNPSKAIPFHKIYNKIFPFPNICFENIIIAKRV